MTVNNPDPTEGDTVAFTLSVTNLGPVAVTAVTAGGALPSGLRYAGHTRSQGDLDTVRGLWQLGPLEVSQEATLVLSAEVGLGTADRSIANSASLVFSSHQDPNPTNDVASAGVVPQLQLTGDAPTFDPARDVMLVEDNFESWTGFRRTSVSSPKLVVYRDSAIGSGNPPATVALVPGRGSSGQAVQITYPTQIGTAQARHYVGTYGISTPAAVSTFQEVWIRVSPGASVIGTSPKWIQHYHPDLEGTSRIQISSFRFGSSDPSLAGLPGRSDGGFDYFHVNSLANSLGLARNGPRWNDVNDGAWHRYTTEVRSHSAQGAGDGVARLWIDGILVVDLSAAGIVAERSGYAELNQLAYNVPITDIHLGELLFLGSTPTWSMDIDDFKRWRVR
jgi:uncharacterized repeat protein (TIGR01451 family)